MYTIKFYGKKLRVSFQYIISIISIRFNWLIKDI